MNRHPGPLSLITLSGIVLLATAWTATLARAQSLSGSATLSDQIKASTDFTAIGQAVEQFLAPQVAALSSDDPAVRSNARDALVEAASARGNISPTFLDVYAKALNDKITPALTSQSEQVRLNAAIVVAKVAEKADNINLRGATLVLLKDKSPIVALWALKAARAVVIPVIRNPGFTGDEMLSGIVATMKLHGTGPLGGPVALDGYDALALDLTITQPTRRPSDRMVITVIPFIHQMLQERVASYRNGIPPEPLAERIPTLFLTHANVWKLHTPEQKLTTMQLISDLIGLVAQHAAAAQGLNRDKLHIILGYLGQTLLVMPEIGGTPELRAKLEPLAKLNERSSSPDVAAAVAPVFEALRGQKMLAKLTPPPSIAAASAGAGGDEEIVETTQPSTRPATTRAATQPGAAPARAAPAPAPGTP